MARKSVIFLIILAGFLTLAGSAFAINNVAPSSPNNNNICPANTVCLTNPLSGVNSITDLINNIIDYVSVVIGSIAVLMFVWSGILFVTSAGNPGKVEQARKVAIYAAIGLGIALAGAGLVQIVRQVIGG